MSPYDRKSRDLERNAPLATEGENVVQWWQVRLIGPSHHHGGNSMMET